MATSQQPDTPEQAQARAAKELKEKRQSQTAEAMASLPPEQRAEIILRRQANIIQAQIAGTNWGKGMDPETRTAVSDWGNRNGVDVTTEIFILGGNIYLNAQFYINRLVSLVNAGKVLDFKQRFVNNDARFDSSIPADVEEMTLRRQLRIMHNVPDDATAAVLTTIVLTSLPGVEFHGVKWAPRHANDPIGKQFPQETALTRSARRCLKQVVRYLPEIARYIQDAEEDARFNVEETIKIDRERQKSVGAGPAEHVKPLDVNGGYGEPEPVRAVREEAPAVVVDFTKGGDAYDNPPTSTPAAPEDPAPVATEQTAPAASVAPVTPPVAAPANAEPINDLDLFTPAERAEYEEMKRLRGL